MRKKIVAGNWKMHLDKAEAVNLNASVSKDLPDNGVAVYQFAPSIYLDTLQQQSTLKIGAQNGHPEDAGAYTGETSMLQLKKLGIQSVLIGHSERRHKFGEDHAFLKEKLNAALSHQLEPFFCCGETLEDREQNNHFNIVKRQLESSCFHLEANTIRGVVFAYEPVWAIGTGKTATPEQANEMHEYIRSIIAERYDGSTADAITILYGGSCKPANASTLFQQLHIDGGLIGGASLNATDFLNIIQSF
ncbi:MAG: triose-phosphate isomerase [Bacteroidota bacterium]